MTFSRVAIFFFAAVTLAGFSAHGQAALAERDFPVERFRPATSAAGIFDAEVAEVQAPLTFDVMLWINYANDPLVLKTTIDGIEEEHPLVAHRLGANLVGSIVLWRRVQLGLDLPMALYQTASRELDELATGVSKITSAGLGNLRLVPKVQLLEAARHGLDVALLASVTLPTKTASAYFGDDGVGFTPELAVSRRVGPLLLAVNASYLARERQEVENLVVDDELNLHAGVAYTLARDGARPLTLAASLASTTSAKEPFAKRNQTANELLLGATYALMKNLDLALALGPGLSSGFGTPDFRVLAGVRLRTERDVVAPPPEEEPPPPPKEAPRDSDGDGILDTDDKCPNEPENFDDWEDEDGCPEEIPDTDGDGINDRDDKCQNEPEDKDGFEDEDGCPDPDNDGDGVLDLVDNCPNEPGEVAFEGCKAKQWVKLSSAKIEITDKVFFDTNRATIQARSFTLLDNLAKVLEEHPEITKVQIEGHTDDVGPAEHNLELSQARAESVLAYLLTKGVAATRLLAVGRGEEQPVMSNKTPMGRATNRRVEFVILDATK